MSSIISYFGNRATCRCMHSGHAAPADVPNWDADLGFIENIEKYSVIDQLRCYLDQAMGIAYYTTFYGKNCHAVVKDYVDEVQYDLGTRALPLFYKTFTEEPFHGLVESLEILYNYIRTQAWEHGFKLDAVDEFLRSSPYWVWPSCWGFHGNDCNFGKETPWYVPYVTWMDCPVFDGNRTISGDLGLIGFSFESMWHWKPRNSPEGGYDGKTYIDPKVPLGTRFYSIGTSFSMRETPFDKSFCSFKILCYLTHFDLSKQSFEKIIGILSDLALFIDPHWRGQAASHELCSAVAAAIRGIYRLTGPGGTNPADSQRRLVRSLAGGFSALKELFDYMVKTYSIRAEYAPIVARVFSCVAENKEQQDAAAAIREQGGGASADELKAAQEVFGGSLEALQFISQSPTLLSAQSQVADASGEDQGEANKSDGNTEPSKNDGQADPGKADPKGDDGKGEGDDDTNPEQDTDEDLGEDDTSSGSDLPDIPDDGSAPDGNSGGSTDPSGSGGAGGSDMQPTEPTVEPQLDTSDDAGVPFEIAKPESETVDSVLFRLEMDHFLTELLAKPPEDMSPQNVATLTALHRFWLYCLSVETIVGIVGRCTTLPETLKKLTTQCTE